MISKIDINEFQDIESLSVPEVSALLEVINTIDANVDLLKEFSSDAKAILKKSRDEQIKIKSNTLFTLEDIINGNISSHNTALSFRKKAVLHTGYVISSLSEENRLDIAEKINKEREKMISSGLLADFFIDHPDEYRFNGRRQNHPLEVFPKGLSTIGKAMLVESGLETLIEYFDATPTVNIYRPSKDLYIWFKRIGLESNSMLNNNLYRNNLLMLSPSIKPKHTSNIKPLGRVTLVGKECLETLERILDIKIESAFGGVYDSGRVFVAEPKDIKVIELSETS